MTFDLNTIGQAADAILHKVGTGEVGDACCMSAIETPITASWEAADRLSGTARLSSTQQKAILKTLKPHIRNQLEKTGYDDFDLIYERLLELVSAKSESKSAPGLGNL